MNTKSPRPIRGRTRRNSTTFVPADRKSTRLNSSHLVISYAVFCLKKKNSFRGVLSTDLPLSPAQCGISRPGWRSWRLGATVGDQGRKCCPVADKSTSVYLNDVACSSSNQQYHLQLIKA